LLGFASCASEEPDEMVAIYLDSGSLADIEKHGARVDGITTNPSIMRKEGITDYRTFARAVLARSGGKSVSFEVLADDFPTMERQAREIASWGENVYVKLPITNTRGESIVPLVDALGELNLNITAVMTMEQWLRLWPSLKPHHIVSVFAGRILDTGTEPPRFKRSDRYRLLWASAREVYHVHMAEDYGYDIITLTPELIAKLDLRGKDLTAYSLETVKQFHSDGKGIEF
jgi:transaldolase